MALLQATRADIEGEKLMEPLEERTLLSTATPDGLGNLVITGNAADADQLTIQSFGSTFTISDPVNLIPNSQTFNFSTFTGQIIFNTGDGNDSLTVNFSTGEFPIPIVFNGGMGEDQLLLNPGAPGLQFSQITHAFSETGPDSITVVGPTMMASTIMYSELEPNAGGGIPAVNDRLAVDERFFNFSTANEMITLSDPMNSDLRLDSDAGESVEFTNPTNLLTINGGSGDDIIVVAGADPGFGASLTINGNEGNDTIQLNANLQYFSGQSLDVNLTNDGSASGVDQIVVGNGVQITTQGFNGLGNPGSIELRASRNIGLLPGSQLQTLQGGNITLEANLGTVGSTVGNFVGIRVNGGSISSDTGNVMLFGRGGDSASGVTHGVLIDSGGSVSGGVVNVTGVGGTGGDRIAGVSVETGASITSSGMGMVTVTGTGGIGSRHEFGVFVHGTITSGGGEVHVTGTGGGNGSSSDNYGVFVESGGRITSGNGSSGHVTVEGTGAGPGGGGFGVRLGSGGQINSGGGNVQVMGTGADGTGNGNHGVEIDSGSSQISAGANGTVTVVGIGRGSGDGNVGVWLESGGTITSSGGNVDVTGSGSNTGISNNVGVYIHPTGGLITATDVGTVMVNGTGGGGSGIFNHGVLLDGNNSRITSVGGAVSVTGNASTGSDNFAIAVYSDNLDLLNPVTTLNGNNGVVLLRPATAGTLIDVGGADIFGGGPTTLGLTDAELNQIAAGQVMLGDPMSGAMTISMPIDLSSNLFDLSLWSGAGISINQSITLAVDRALFVKSESGAIQMDAVAVVTATGNSRVALVADVMTLDGMVNAGTGVVELSGASVGRAINLGAADDPATGGHLGLTDMELDQVTAGIIQIGDAMSGPVTISQTIDRAAASTTHLILTTSQDTSITFEAAGLLDAGMGDVSLAIGGFGTTVGGGGMGGASGTGGIVAGANSPQIKGNLLSLGARSGGIGDLNNSLTFDANFLRTRTDGNGPQFLREDNTVTIFDGGDPASSGLNAGVGTIAFDGGSFTFPVANLINDEATVDVRSGSTLEFGTNNEAVQQWILSSGSITGSGILTGSSTFELQSGSISANLAGNVGLTKSVDATVTLSGNNNSYTGTTLITGGILVLTGMNTNNTIPSSMGIVLGGAELDVTGLDTGTTADALILASSQVLSGTGTVTGKLIASNGSIVAPGDSPGIISSGSINLQAGSMLNIEVNGNVAGMSYDQLDVTGSVTLGDATLNLSGTIASSPGQQIVIIKNDLIDPVVGLLKDSDGMQLLEGATVTINGVDFILSYAGGAGGNDVTLTEAGAITVASDGNGTGLLELRVDGGNLRFVDDGQIVDARPFAAVQNHFVTVTGSAQADSLTLNFAGSNLHQTAGINFDGGAGFDLLVLTGVGNQYSRHTYNATNANDGSIVLTGGVATNFTVNYTGLEPITNDGTATDIVFNLPMVASNAELRDDDNSGNGMSRLQSLNMTFEQVDFVNPTSSLTINRGNAADTLTVQSLPDFNAALTIGSGLNPIGAVTFSGALTLGAGQALTANAAGTISFNSASADIAATGMGTITLTTERDVRLASGSSVVVADGDLLVEANQQAMSTTGNFIGVDVDNGVLQSTGTGLVTVRGRGGNDGGGTQVGVYVRNGGDIIGGSTTVTVEGTGGAGAGANNLGVWVHNDAGVGSSITSAGGNISVTGVAGISGFGVTVTEGQIMAGGNGTVFVQGTGGSANSGRGVFIHGAGEITSAGNGSVTVQGTGGAGTGSGQIGVLIGNMGSRISSGGGNVIVIGTGGGGAGAGTDNDGVQLTSSALVTAGGMGTVTVTGTAGAGTGTDNQGLFLTNSGTAITSNNGAINVTGIGSAAGEAILLDSGTAITSGNNAAITLTADSASLSGSVSAGSGLVAIATRTAGTRIGLGETDVLTGSPLTLGLTDSELDGVTAGTLRIGDVNSGTITIAAAIDPGSVSLLALQSGGAIIDSNAIGSDLTVTSLVLAAVNGIGNDDPIETSVVNLEAVNNGSGGVFVSNTGALTIGGLTAVNGVSSAGGGISLIASSPLTVNEAVTDSGGGAIFLTANGSTAADVLTLNANVTATGGDGSIELNAGDDLIQSDNVVVSAAGSGSVTYNAGTGTSSGDIRITNSAGGTTVSITSGSGTISLNAKEGVLLSGPDADVTTTGDFVALADQDGSGVGTYTQGDVGSAISAGNVQLAAADINLVGTINVTSSGGGITIQSSDGSRPMSFGGADDAVAGINLTDAEMSRITTTSTGKITIGDASQSGNITFTTATVATTAGAALFVEQATASGGSIRLDDAGGTGTALNGNGGSISLTADTGGIQAVNANDNAAEIATTGASVVLVTPGAIGSDTNRIQFADNGGAAVQRIFIGDEFVSASNVALDGLGSLTLASIAATATNVDVRARTNLVVESNASISSGASAMSLAADVNSDGSGHDGIGTLTVQGNALLNSAFLNLRGADIEIAATSNIGAAANGPGVQETNGIEIRSSLATRPMSLGGANNAVAGVNLTDAELARMLTRSGGVVRIGDAAQSGNITFVTARPATTSGARTDVIQATGSAGAIRLNDGGGAGMALDGSGSSVTLTSGMGGIQAVNAPNGTAEIGNSTLVTLASGGEIGTSNDLQLAANNVSTDTSATNGNQKLQALSPIAVDAFNAGGGTIVLSSGTFNLSGDNVLVDATLIEVSGGTLFFDAFSDTIDTLTLSGGSVTGSGTLTTANAIQASSGSASVVLGGTSGLIKSTAGIVTLSAENNYTGSTLVLDGTLLVNGSLSAGSNVLVGTGATLGGSGTINGMLTVNLGGTLSPGNSPGILTAMNGVSFASGANFTVEVNGNKPGTEYDQLNVTGSVDLTGTVLNISGTSSITSSPGQQIVLILNDGTDAVIGQLVDGSGSTLAEGATVTVNGVDFILSYASGAGGNDVTLTEAGGMWSLTETSGPTGRWSIRLQSGNIQVLTGTNIFDARPASANSAIEILGQPNLDDFLTLDFADGNPIPAAGLTFDGGTGGVDGLILQNVGTGFATHSYNYTNANDGSVVLRDTNGSDFTINYLGLEPISNTGTATDLVFNLPGVADDAITLSDLGGGMARLESGNGTFETTDFAYPAAGGSLTINLGNGNQTIAVTSLSLNSNTRLRINGGAGADVINLNAAGGITAGALELLAETIAQSERVTVIGTTALDAGLAGTITLTDASNNFRGAVTIVVANDVSLTDVDEIVLDGIRVGGNFTVTAGRDISDSGELVVTGNARFDSGTDGISLVTGMHRFGSLTFVSGGVVLIREADDIVLAGTNTAAGLALTSAGTITDGSEGDLAVDGGARFVAPGSIILGNDAGNDFRVGRLTVSSGDAVFVRESDATVLTGTNNARTLNLISAGSITDVAGVGQSGVITRVEFNASFTGTSITLGDSPADVVQFGSLTFNSTGNVAITEDDATQFAGSNTAANVVVISAGTITDLPNTDLAVAGQASFVGELVTLGDDPTDMQTYGTISFVVNPQVVTLAQGDAEFAFVNEALSEVYRRNADTDPNNNVSEAEIRVLMQQLTEQVVAHLGLTDAIVLLIDPVDFVVTDFQGRQGGVVGDNVRCEIPGSYYSGNGTVELFIIPLVTEGGYRMQLTGVGDGNFRIANNNVEAGQSELSYRAGHLNPGSNLTVALEGTPLLPVRYGLGFAAADSQQAANMALNQSSSPSPFEFLARRDNFDELEDRELDNLDNDRWEELLDALAKANSLRRQFSRQVWDALGLPFGDWVEEKIANNSDQNLTDDFWKQLGQSLSGLPSSMYRLGDLLDSLVTPTDSNPPGQPPSVDSPASKLKRLFELKPRRKPSTKPKAPPSKQSQQPESNRQSAVQSGAASTRVSQVTPSQDGVSAFLHSCWNWLVPPANHSPRPASAPNSATPTSAS